MTADVNTLALTDGGPIELNLEALIGSHLCIVANSGAGKSGTIRKVLEVTHGRVQHIVIDTEDEFYTLREKFEYLIAGGDNGDCVATVSNAAKLAMTILETGFSAIVQINSLSLGDREAFISAFLSALTAAPKSLWRPVLVVLDEAQFYAPQKGYAGSLEAIVSFMMLGRKRGFTGVLATPRLSDLNKQATGPVNNWLIGCQGQPVDRRSASDALGFPANSVEARNLRSLISRQFWVFGRALLSEPTLARIEKTQTTIIKAGQAAPPTPPAPAAMQRILASLNAAAVEKKDEAPLPNLASNFGSENGSAEIDQAVIDAAEQRGFERGEAIGFERGAAAFQAEVVEWQHRIKAAADALGLQIDAPIKWTTPADLVPGPHQRVRDLGKPNEAMDRAAGDAMRAMTTGKGIDIPQPRQLRAPADPNAVPPAASKILAAIDLKGAPAMTWTMIALLTGYSESGGQFRRGKKWLIDTGAVVEVAPNGAKIAKVSKNTQPMPSGDELIAMWVPKLPPAGQATLKALWAQARARSGGMVTIEGLAAQLNYATTGGQWRRGVKALRDACITQNAGAHISFTADFLQIVGGRA